MPAGPQFAGLIHRNQTNDDIALMRGSATVGRPRSGG